MVEAGISGLKITSPNKYILYIAGVILILSVFVDAPNINNTEIRNVALIIVAVGLSIWLVGKIFTVIGEYWRCNKRVTNEEYNTWTAVMYVIFIVIQVIVWLIVFLEYIAPHL